jgi:general secretion pathway protein M
MKMTALIRRVAALGILLGLVLGFWVLLPQQLIDAFLAHRDSIAHSQELLARYQRIEASRANLDSDLKQLQDTEETEGRLLTGASTQLAGAELQTKLKALIKSNHASLTSMQVLPVRDEHEFKRVSISVTLSARLKTLVPILFSIETQHPYLFIEDLELRKTPGLVKVSDTTDDLQVKLTVVGYMTAKK